MVETYTQKLARCLRMAKQFHERAWVDTQMVSFVKHSSIAWQMCEPERCMQASAPSERKP